MRNSSLWGIFCLFVSFVFVGLAEANTLFSIDSLLDYLQSHSVVRAYTIEGNAIANPVTFSEETIGLGPVGIAASMDLGLDLGISSCYNKIILLSGKMLGIRETFERERSKS